MRHEVYPKLAITNRTWGPTPAGKPPAYRHQGVLLVPGISSTCAGTDEQCSAMEDVIVQKLEQFFEWAKQDWLVGGFMPWVTTGCNPTTALPGRSLTDCLRLQHFDDSSGPDPMGDDSAIEIKILPMKNDVFGATRCADAHAARSGKAERDWNVLRIAIQMPSGFGTSY